MSIVFLLIVTIKGMTFRYFFFTLLLVVFTGRCTRAELSLLDENSFVQLFTSPDCGVKTVRPNHNHNTTITTTSATKADLFQFFPKIVRTSSNLNSTSDCYWKRLQFDFRLLERENSSLVFSSLHLVSGEFVSLESLNISVKRVPFHIFVTSEGHLNVTLFSSSFSFEVIKSYDNISANTNHSTLLFQSINKLQLLFGDHGLKVTLNKIPLNSMIDTRQWIEIKVQQGLWRFSRQLRIGQTIQSLSFNHSSSSFSSLTNSTTVARPHTLCLSNFYLNQQNVSLLRQRNTNNRLWSDHYDPLYSPYRSRTFGSVANGCGTSTNGCQPKCLHDAVCRTDLNGQGYCDCESVGYAGIDCYFRK